MKRLLVLGLILVVAASGLALAGKKSEDDERIANLEARVAELEQKLTQLTSPDNAELAALINETLAGRETAAAGSFREIVTLVNQGKQLEAKSKMDAFQRQYAGTEASRQAARFTQELAVVGRNAPASVAVEKWFVGDEGESLQISSEGTSLLVFFEEWCPHCKREVPKLQATYDKFKDSGLQIIGLTKVTKSATDEKVAAFCSSNKLQFPVIKENGEASRAFNVGAIPAAAVVQNGKIIWRGHPGRLNDALLESWL